AETTVGRGRMYAKAKHYAHAISILQQASLARLARLLQLGNETRPQAILAETAERLDRPVAELHELYTPPARRLTAAQFVTWAQQLQQLEQQARDRVTAPTKESEVNHTAHPALNDVRVEVAKAVVGQDHAVTSLLIGLLAEGHVLLEGVPGVAKTLLVRSLSEAMDLQNARVQFTPDLMPGDVTGSLIFPASTSDFNTRQAPGFTNLVQADEINRTPPKTQAALLDAMEEHQVSVDGTTYPLSEPFMVSATQNPIEYEGTYPLPEAQLD